MSGATEVRILGIGSPFGADRVGWEAIEHLRRRGFDADAELGACDRPGPGLIERLRGARRALLIDAVVDPGAAPGSVRLLDAAQLAQQTTPFSSHGLGVAESLALAAALGELPPSLAVLGIAVNPASPEPPAIDYAELERQVCRVLP